MVRSNVDSWLVCPRAYRKESGLETDSPRRRPRERVRWRTAAVLEVVAGFFALTLVGGGVGEGGGDAGRGGRADLVPGQPGEVRARQRVELCRRGRARQARGRAPAHDPGGDGADPGAVGGGGPAGRSAGAGCGTGPAGPLGAARPCRGGRAGGAGGGGVAPAGAAGAAPLPRVGPAAGPGAAPRCRRRCRCRGAPAAVGDRRAGGRVRRLLGADGAGGGGVRGRLRRRVPVAFDPGGPGGARGRAGAGARAGPARRAGPGGRAGVPPVDDGLRAARRDGRLPARPRPAPRSRPRRVSRRRYPERSSSASGGSSRTRRNCPEASRASTVARHSPEDANARGSSTTTIWRVPVARSTSRAAGVTSPRFRGSSTAERSASHGAGVWL